MKQLSDFFTRIQAHVMNCPEPTIAQAVLDTCIEFAETSKAMREELEAFPTEVDVTDYEVLVPSQTRVHLFTQMWIDDKEATLLPREAVKLCPGTRARPSKAYTRRSAGQFFLTFTNPPDGVYQVRLEAALCPARNATQVDDDYFDLWVDGIVAGAVARLKEMPGNAWTDPLAATNMRAKFLTEAGRAEREALYGRVQGSLNVKPRPLVMGYRR